MDQLLLYEIREEKYGLTFRSGNDKVNLALAEQHQSTREFITEEIGLSPEPS